MKKYINQIFEEGLANTIYIPLHKKIKKMTNKKLSKTINVIWKIVYILLVIAIAILLLICKL